MERAEYSAVARLMSTLVCRRSGDVDSHLSPKSSLVTAASGRSCGYMSCAWRSCCNGCDVFACLQLRGFLGFCAKSRVRRQIAVAYFQARVQRRLSRDDLRREHAACRITAQNPGIDVQ